jgi:hypothetical protein
VIETPTLSLSVPPVGTPAGTLPFANMALTLQDRFPRRLWHRRLLRLLLQAAFRRGNQEVRGFLQRRGPHRQPDRGADDGQGQRHAGKCLRH